MRTPLENDRLEIRMGLRHAESSRFGGRPEQLHPRAPRILPCEDHRMEPTCTGIPADCLPVPVTDPVAVSAV
jgi:hypothetical protein